MENRLHFVIVFSCFMLCACASAPPAADHGEVVLGNIPFHPQEDYQCGPASLAGVFNYHGLSIAPGEIAHDLFSKSAGGTLTIDMALYPQQKGFYALSYSGSLRNLKENIDSGYPLIVMVDYGFSMWQKNHFMVVVGYNNDSIIVNSGKKERELVRKDDFLRNWKRTDFWTLLVKKK